LEISIFYLWVRAFHHGKACDTGPVSGLELGMPVKSSGEKLVNCKTLSGEYSILIKIDPGHHFKVILETPQSLEVKKISDGKRVKIILKDYLEITARHSLCCINVLI
jgi:hypothetical protein